MYFSDEWERKLLTSAVYVLFDPSNSRARVKLALHHPVHHCQQRHVLTVINSIELKIAALGNTSIKPARLLCYNSILGNMSFNIKEVLTTLTT